MAMTADPNGQQPVAAAQPQPFSAPPSSNGGAEIEPDSAAIDRSLVVDGEHWTAYISGRGAYGTGPCGLASVQAVHFALAGDPGKPLFEALIPAGRFPAYYESELLDLFRSARKIVIPEGGAAVAPRRFSLSDDT